MEERLSDVNSNYYFGCVVTTGCGEIKKQDANKRIVIEDKYLIEVNKEIEKSLCENMDKSVMGYSIH